MTRYNAQASANREKLLAEAGTPDELSVSRLANELVVFDDHVAAQEHHLRRAGHLGTLE
jgi:hypothetical protein